MFPKLTASEADFFGSAEARVAPACSQLVDLWTRSPRSQATFGLRRRSAAHSRPPADISTSCSNLELRRSVRRRGLFCSRLRRHDAALVGRAFREMAIASGDVEGMVGSVVPAHGGDGEPLLVRGGTHGRRKRRGRDRRPSPQPARLRRTIGPGARHRLADASPARWRLRPSTEAIAQAKLVAPSFRDRGIAASCIPRDMLVIEHYRADIPNTVRAFPRPTSLQTDQRPVQAARGRRLPSTAAASTVQSKRLTASTAWARSYRRRNEVGSIPRRRVRKNSDRRARRPAPCVSCFSPFFQASSRHANRPMTLKR